MSSHLLNFENKGSILSSIVTDGKDRHELKSKKLGNILKSWCCNCNHASPKNYYGLVLPNEICLIPLSQVHSSINYLNLCCMNEDSSELTLKTYPGDIAPLMKLLKSLFWIYNSRIIIIIIIMIIIIGKFLWSAAIHTCNLSALWKCKKQNIRNIQTKLLVT